MAIESGDELIDDATNIFHLQQAAEKLTKSLLAYHNIHFEKTHDLTALVELCNKSNRALPDFAVSFYHLNPFAVIGSYDIVSTKKLSLISNEHEFFYMELKITMRQLTLRSFFFIYNKQRKNF